jgi:hypothetical protein
MNQSHKGRFKDAIWANKVNENMQIIIGGAGGIGTWLTLLLSRLGEAELFVYDFDTIETHNIGGQLLMEKSIGKQKVEDLSATVLMYSGSYISALSDTYTKDSLHSPYMFAAFDNMAARKVMFENWIENYAHDPEAIFIDGSVTLDQYQIRCVTPATAENYRTTRLVDDSEIEEIQCTLKQTSHMAALVAAKMVCFFVNHLTKASGSFAKVPEFDEYILPLNLTR